MTDCSTEVALAWPVLDVARELGVDISVRRACTQEPRWEGYFLVGVSDDRFLATSIVSPELLADSFAMCCAIRQMALQLVDAHRSTEVGE